MSLPGSNRGETEECELLVERDAENEAAVPAVHIFGLVNDDEIATYFRSRPLAVSAVTGPPALTEQGWMITLNYPSFNSGGEGGGSTVIYPHQVSLIWDEEQGQALSGLDLGQLMLVFEVDNEARPAYRWVGCALPKGGVSLDWFAASPELLYQASPF